MFPDSEVAQKFSCGHKNTCSYYQGGTGPTLPRKNTSKFFPVLMDESNDKTDKSYIILVCEEGDVKAISK